MGCTVTRTCKKCNNQILINIDNLNSGEFVKYKNIFYHTECFIEYANKQASKKGVRAEGWKEALNYVDEYKLAAKNAAKTRIYQDELNVYLLEHYDVATLSSYFWMVISDIENGIYRKKRCKSIETNKLTAMWKYYQKELDDTYKYNLQNGKEITGESRVLYDLSTIMSNYAKITKGIAKEKARAEEFIKIDEPKIDYEKISKPKIEQKKDLSSLFG